MSDENKIHYIALQSKSGVFQHITLPVGNNDYSDGGPPLLLKVTVDNKSFGPLHTKYVRCLGSSTSHRGMLHRLYIEVEVTKIKLNL